MVVEAALGLDTPLAPQPLIAVIIQPPRLACASGCIERLAGRVSPMHWILEPDAKPEPWKLVIVQCEDRAGKTR